MRKIKRSCLLAGNLFLYEWKEKRTLTGVLAGMVTPFYWLRKFLEYAQTREEPVNILEAFIVLEQESQCILFLALGFLLAVSDAPFVNGNTCYSLYRAGKHSWNRAMLLYIILQAFVYTALTALPMILASLPNGFSGKIWSSPVYVLAKGYDVTDVGAQIFSPSIELMKYMNVPQAFLATAMFFFLYLVLLGVILYTFNLLFGSMTGSVIVLLFHIGGYLSGRFEIGGRILPEYAIAANFVIGKKLSLQPVFFMVFIIAILMLSQYLLIDRAEFPTNIRGKQ